MAHGNLFARDDTFIGVCQGLGEDLGFNPDWLRVALGLGLFWNPVAVIAGYHAAGLVVLVGRWAFPEAKEEVVAPAVAANDEGAPTAIAA